MHISRLRALCIEIYKTMNQLSCFRALGPRIWKGLPNEIKSAQNIHVFKRLIKEWDGVHCNCNECQFAN